MEVNMKKVKTAISEIQRHEEISLFGFFDKHLFGNGYYFEFVREEIEGRADRKIFIFWWWWGRNRGVKTTILDWLDPFSINIRRNITESVKKIRLKFENSGMNHDEQRYWSKILLHAYHDAQNFLFGWSLFLKISYGSIALSTFVFSFF